MSPSPQSPQDPDHRRSRRRDWWLLAATLAIIAILAVLITRPGPDGEQISEQADGSPQSTSADRYNVNTGPAADLPRRPDDSPLVLGSPDAPVTMVEFVDFRCPFCGQFARDIKPELIERYVEPGLLRIEWRDSPIFGEQSRRAARAGRAAAEQDRFWEFVAAVMADAPLNGHPSLTDDVLAGFAETAGVDDLDRFRRDLAGDRFDAEIDADADLALELFIPTTPAFWINGTPILGSQPLQVFVDVIEGSLRP